MIYYSKRNAENNRTAQYFIMIYQGLKPNAVYWEFINTLRKIVILISLLLPLNIGIITSAVMLVLTARFQIWLKPYKNHEHYKVEFLAIMAGVATIMSALIYSRNEQHTNLNSVVFISIVVMNIKFLVEWLYLPAQIYKDKNSATLMIYKFISKILCKRALRADSQMKSKKNASEELVPKDLAPCRATTPKKLLSRPKKYKKLRRKKNKAHKPTSNDDIDSSSIKGNNQNSDLVEAIKVQDQEYTSTEFFPKLKHKNEEEKEQYIPTSMRGRHRRFGSPRRTTNLMMPNELNDLTETVGMAYQNPSAIRILHPKEADLLSSLSIHDY